MYTLAEYLDILNNPKAAIEKRSELNQPKMCGYYINAYESKEWHEDL